MASSALAASAARQSGESARAPPAAPASMTPRTRRRAASRNAERESIRDSFPVPVRASGGGNERLVNRYTARERAQGPFGPSPDAPRRARSRALIPPSH